MQTELMKIIGRHKQAAGVADLTAGMQLGQGSHKFGSAVALLQNPSGNQKAEHCSSSCLGPSSSMLLKTGGHREAPQGPQLCLECGTSMALTP